MLPYTRAGGDKETRSTVRRELTVLNPRRRGIRRETLFSGV
jgi:hypothetical protein